MLYKRGNVWWYKFSFAGVTIRESARTRNKKVAVDAERERRRQLEMGANHLVRREPPVLLKVAAKRWLESLTVNKLADPKRRVHLLVQHLGDRLITDITPEHVARYQQKRLKDGAAPRTVNMEVACLRGILKRHGLWAPIADQVRHLREPETIGRAVDPADEERLLQACGKSPNPALLPAVVLSLDTGLRRSELRGLRHHDLRLTWDGDSIAVGELVVTRSKTRAGEGRVVPLSRRCREVLASWLEHFPGAGPTSFIFPSFRLGGGKDVRRLWGLDLESPMGSFKRAWSKAQERAGTSYRWHDLRHTFVTRLCESPAVTEQTIRSLAGHVSTKMLERYSHIRVDAKRAAIDALENRTGHKIRHSGEMEGSEE